MPDTPTFVPEIHETLERLDLALEGADLGVWDWEPLENTVHFDRRWCEMLGLDFERTPMQFDTWRNLVHPEDLEACMRAVAAHMDGHTPRYEALHRVRHADGGWRFILARGRVSARDADGRPTRVTGTHLDLTGTALGKRTVEEVRAQLAVLASESPFAIALLDTERRYAGASALWRAEFGLGNETVVGRPFIPQARDGHPDWSAVMTRILAGEERISGGGEPEQVTEGSHRWVHWFARTMRHEGTVQGVLLSFDDITDAVQALRLREADLEARLNDLSAFAGNLAQELKTPLQVIGMAAGALERGVRAETPDRAKLLEGTRALAEMARRAAAVATALRTLAQRGRAAQASQVSVAELFSNAEALTHGRYQQSGVALTFHNTATSTPAGRPADLMRITMDLLEHALESALVAEVGRDRWVRLEASEADGEVVIRCVDGGLIGAPAAQAGMDAPTDPTAAPGTRALRIARVLAERANGTLRAVPGEPHRTFEVRLPILA